MLYLITDDTHTHIVHDMMYCRTFRLVSLVLVDFVLITCSQMDIWMHFVCLFAVVGLGQFNCNGKH